MTIDLVLSVKTKRWRSQDDNREDADDLYQQKRVQILARHRYTCQGCGFVTRPDRDAGDGSYKASGYLEVHHINDDHADNSDSNLVALCPLCHSVFSIGNVGHRKAGRIISFPWLSQADINLLVNCALVQVARGETYSDIAKQLIGWLAAYESRVSQTLTVDAADPKKLGAALYRLYGIRPDLYERRQELLSDLRLIPTEGALTDAVQWWADHSAWLPSDQWPAIHEGWLARFKGEK